MSIQLEIVFVTKPLYKYSFSIISCSSNIVAVGNFASNIRRIFVNLFKNSRIAMSQVSSIMDSTQTFMRKTFLKHITFMKLTFHIYRDWLMNFCVLGAIKYFKVLDSIIQFIVIYMMNNLRRLKLSSEMIFHYKTMLKNSLVITKRNYSIAILNNKHIKSFLKFCDSYSNDMKGLYHGIA